MTVVTVILGLGSKVIPWRFGRTITTTVTRLTSHTAYVLVIKCGANEAAAGGMAAIAIQARGYARINMPRRWYSGRVSTIVTRDACYIADGTMIKHPSREGIGAMADTTILTRLNMGRVGLGILACGVGTVMTGNTSRTRDLGATMSKLPWQEAGGFMAHTAIFVGWHVVGVFPGGDFTIVT